LKYRKIEENDSMRYIAHAALLFSFVVLMPLSALAGNVLFHGKAQQIGIFTRTNASIPSTNPKILETSANGFTLPSGAFSASGSTYTQPLLVIPTSNRPITERTLMVTSTWAEHQPAR
jgi:hypothetical protein